MYLDRFKILRFKSPFYADWLFWFVICGAVVQVIVNVIEWHELSSDDAIIFTIYMLIWAFVGFFRAADDATRL